MNRKLANQIAFPGSWYSNLMTRKLLGKVVLAVAIVLAVASTSILLVSGYSIDVWRTTRVVRSVVRPECLK